MLVWIRKNLPILIICAFIVFWTVHQPSSLKAQVAAKSWFSVQVVTYASGLTGFFDANTGKLYLYDSNLEQPVAIRQVGELGKPLKKIK
jgi:hypothetical protein